MTDTDHEATASRGQAEGDVLGFAVEAARLLEDLHCTDVRLLDLRGISQVCDFILIGSGTSDRQMRSVADEIGTAEEVAAAGSIAARGIVLLASAHGTCLEQLAL